MKKRDTIKPFENNDDAFCDAEAWLDMESELHDTAQSTIRLVEILQSEAKCSELFKELFGLTLFAQYCLDKEETQKCYDVMQVLALARSALKNAPKEFQQKMGVKWGNGK